MFSMPPATTIFASPSAMAWEAMITGLNAGPADFVDRGGADRVGNSGPNRCLSGRRLTEAGAENTAHIHVVHAFGRNLNALQCFSNGDAA